MIAEYTINVMFGDPNLPTYYSYQIYEDGYTQLVTQMMNSDEQKIEVLKPFNENETQEISDLVKTIVPGELIDSNVGYPGCMDAPSLSMSVYSNNNKIVIAQTVSCKSMDRVNKSTADEKMINILNELSQSVK